MKKRYISFGLFGLCLSTFAGATSLSASILTNPQEQLNRYKTVSTVSVGDITVPQVVLLELEEDSYGSTVLVDEEDKQVPIRSYTGVFPKKELPVSYSNFSSSLGQLQKDTGVYYFDSREQVHTFEVQVTGGSANYMSIDFVNNTLPPKNISVEYKQDGEWIPIVTKIVRTNNIPLGSIARKENETIDLRVTLESKNLVGMIGVDVFSDNNENGLPAIYWYAQPNSEYVLYQNPSFGQKTNYYVSSDQPLAFDDLTPRVVATNVRSNPYYNADYDGDGIEDEQDLCPRNKDSNNTDADGNGRGDACEDKDLDGKVAGDDNCPTMYNPKQEDEDADGVGNECDQTDDRVSEGWIYLEVVLFVLGSGVLLWLVYRARKQV